MLTTENQTMLAEAQSMLDEIYIEAKKKVGYSRKSDGAVTVLFNYGNSENRYNPPLIQVEVVSFSLNQGKQALFLFDSVVEACGQIKLWYDDKESLLNLLDKNKK
jgi:hypothetical protein